MERPVVVLSIKGCDVKESLRGFRICLRRFTRVTRHALALEWMVHI